jgi:hypothetical protein
MYPPMPPMPPMLQQKSYNTPYASEKLAATGCIHSTSRAASGRQ